MTYLIDSDIMSSYLDAEPDVLLQRTLDLMIAATAIEHDLVLLTHNRADYAEVPGLVIH